MRRFYSLLLLVPAGLVLVLLVGWFALALAFFPPVVSGVALGMFAVVLLWVIVRRRHSAAPGSEVSLMGRSRSTEGLL